jgi:hypothetical protein
LRNKIFLTAFSLTICLCQSHFAHAGHTISSSPANTGSFTDSDATFLTVDANITQTNGDGSGGTINLTAGTVLTINQGRTLDVSATVAGKNGGTISLNAPAILVNGILKANGNGSGRGGTINLNGTGTGSAGNNYIKLGAKSNIEAMGGASNGLGGVVNIIGSGSTYVQLLAVTTGTPSGRGTATITTNGVTASGANEIYITGDGTDNSSVAINNAGDIYASATTGSGSSGGLIRFTTTKGGIDVTGKVANIEAKGDGAGTGGTLDFSMSNGSGTADIGSLFTGSNQSTIDISGGGGTDTGLLRFGRSNSGDLSIDWGMTVPTLVDNGIANVYIGNSFNSNTVNITSSNYNGISTFAGSPNATPIFKSTGNITATNGNNFTSVSATSTSGGAITITDDTLDMTLTTVSTSGAATLNASAGNLTVQGASVGGTTILQAKNGNNITANSATNTFSGNVLAYGNASGNAAGAVTIGSTGALTVTSLNAASAALEASSGALTVSNATVTGATTLTATGNITGTTTDNYGTSIAATSSGGGDITLTESTGNMNVTTLSTSGNATLKASAGTLTLSGASMTGAAKTTLLQSASTVVASNASNNFAGKVSAYGNAGSGTALTSVNVRSSGSLNMDTVNTGTATYNAAGGSLTVANNTITGVSTLTSSTFMTGTSNNDFGTSTTATSGTNLTLTDKSGAFTLANITAGTNATIIASSATGDITINAGTIGGILTANAGSAGSARDLTLANTSVTGTTTLTAGGNITATTLNYFTGSIAAYGSNGTNTYAGTVNIRDNTGDLTLTRLNATNGTITANVANSNLTASNVLINNGTVAFVAPKNMTLSTSTIDGTDTLLMTSSGNGNFTFTSNTISALTGTTAAPAGTGGVKFGTTVGDVTLTSNTITGATSIGSSGTPMGGNITGTGNTFTGSTGFYTATGTKDISFTTTNFVDTTNAFSGRNVTASDNNGALTISSVTATTLTSATTQNSATADLTISNANVSTSSSLSAQNTLTATSGITELGAITATAGIRGTGNLDITETTAMNVSSVTNSSTTGTTNLTSTGGAITGKGTAVNDVISAGSGAVALTASGAAGTRYISTRVNVAGNLTAKADGKSASNNSVELFGTVGGNLSATNSTSGNTTGHIILGDWNTSKTLNVTGTTSFKSATDVNAYGTFTGGVSGNGARVDWWQVNATNLNVDSITATATGNAANELFAGYGNVLNLYVPNASIVDTSNPNAVNLTAANGGITEWAGVDATKTGSYIKNGISTGGDVYLWASGDTNSNGTGTSINVTTGNIGGNILATSPVWNPDPLVLNYERTTGDISIRLTSGNLTTSDIGAGRNLTLTATNGSILQNNVYNIRDNITIAVTGNATLQAGDAPGDATSAIGSFASPVGLYVEGNTTFIAAGKDGANDSVVAVGRIEGTTTVKDESNAAVSGDVYLGTDIGANPNNLNDSDGTMDTYGNVNVNALGDVYLNGGVALNGSITVTGNSVTIRQDIGTTKIANINTTKTTGTAVDIFNYSNSAITGALMGNNITTAGTSSILLKAGDNHSADGFAYVYGLGVNTGGNLTVYTAGDSNGTAAGGVSVDITGTVAGASNAYNESGGSPYGTTSMP